MGVLFLLKMLILLEINILDLSTMKSSGLDRVRFLPHLIVLFWVLYSFSIFYRVLLFKIRFTGIFFLVFLDPIENQVRGTLRNNQLTLSLKFFDEPSTGSEEGGGFDKRALSLSLSFDVVLSCAPSSVRWANRILF